LGLFRAPDLLRLTKIMCCSTVNFQTVCRSFPYPILLRIRQLIECRQTRLLDGRNVHEHVFTAALRLNKSIALGRIEPLHGTFWHYCSSEFTRERIRHTYRKESQCANVDPGSVPVDVARFHYFHRPSPSWFAFKVWLAETFWLQDRCFLRPGVIQWQRK
jgi:hypothetical protein